jgi:hypothetical protein
LGTDKPESLLKGKDIEFGAWKVYELTVTTNGDYATLDEFDSTLTLDIATMVRKDDRTEITVSITNNKVTVNDASVTSSTPVILFAVGVLA